MLPKNILLSLLVATVSANALPNPVDDVADLEARDDDDFLVSRDRHDDSNRHDCGRDAYWRNGNCFCRHSDQQYDSSSRRCHCRGDQYYDYRMNRCTCRRGWSWDTRRNRCRRGSGGD
ncbi:hypothetical protein QQZ08_001359 [Neonectria magnoliae]|uniref:Uncharacterized protein n=1 Tax=Neonectria magnoliae TaxID=2732573 RepID=A0ABR1IET5_9HYPO